MKRIHSRFISMAVALTLGSCGKTDSSTPKDHENGQAPIPPDASAGVGSEPRSVAMIPADAPNILVILLDDAGFAQSNTVGGDIHTPTFTRIAESGILYNAFHTTAISSATRASLLTGRNHHHVGNGTITELASDYKGYNGIIPKTAATLPQVLRHNGYRTAAFGKWHNTLVKEATPQGPFDRWPQGYGFDYFYGFLGGETDQYHPSLFDQTKPVEPPRNSRYHLTEDLTSRAIQWLKKHKAESSGKPFFMYWAPGAVHAPHQVFKEWSDKYRGKFDDGWDAYRERVFRRQKALGWIPSDTVNTPRPKEMRAWNSLSPEEKKFQARLMEVFAGFLEHTDAQAGKIVNALEQLNLRENTIIFYIFSDNGASSEGMKGSISDLVGLNGLTISAKDHMKALNAMYGDLSALGGPKIEGHYNAAWAWASSSPFVGTKLVAGYFGGTRTPLAISWPRRIVRDKKYRLQFHHVNDIAPTIYEVTGITPPAVFNGVKQDHLDGISMAYTFKDANAPTRKKHQYFEIMGSRAMYYDGWIASVLGPRKPWVADQSAFFTIPGKLGILLKQSWIGDTFGWMKWKPEKDIWSLYDLKNDYSQSRDLSEVNTAKVKELKKKFHEEALANNVYPLEASFDRIVHSRRHSVKGNEWRYSGTFSRMPEGAAPNIKSRDNLIRIDLYVPDGASGVLFSLGDIGGGIALYFEKGILTYEYNWYALERTVIRAQRKLKAGHTVIEVEMNMAPLRWAGPATVTLRANGRELAEGTIPRTAPFALTATGTFDVGRDLLSPVSIDYYDRAPFAYNGKINNVTIRYL